MIAVTSVPGHVGFTVPVIAYDTDADATPGAVSGLHFKVLVGDTDRSSSVSFATRTSLAKATAPSELPRSADDAFRQFVSRYTDAWSPALANSRKKRVAALAELDAAWREASIPNWDRQGALPVHAQAVAAAQKFLRLLPASAPDPEVSVDPDGDVSLEWYHGPRAVFSVAIDGTGTIHYAGLFGQNKTHGAEEFAGALPEQIAVNLARLAGEAARL